MTEILTAEEVAEMQREDPPPFYSVRDYDGREVRLCRNVDDACAKARTMGGAVFPVPSDKWAKLLASHEALRAERDALMASVDRMRLDIEHLFAVAERDTEGDTLRARVARLEAALREVRPAYEHHHDCGFYAYRWNGESKCAPCSFAKAHAIIDAALAADAKEPSDA